MILLAFTFLAELIVAFICFIVLRRVFSKRPAATLVLVAALTGLPAGWVVGYRAIRGLAWNNYYSVLNQEHRKATGTDLTAQQFNELARPLQDNPDFLMSLHKGAAIHAIPAFIVVLIALGAFAKRRDKKRTLEE